MLLLQNITKSYHKHIVINIPSFQIEKGVYWIKGANGSGKTTLLKLMVGLLSFEGDITVNDISLKKQPLLYRKQISWSEAEPLFPSFLRGTDLIKLYCNVRETPIAEADKLFTLLKMNDYISDAIGTYSAGMTKKLSLLLSFIGKPSLVILDEPFITLDVDTVSIVARLITERNQKDGTSFIISSHQDIDMRALHFDRSFVLSDKMLVAE